MSYYRHGTIPDAKFEFSSSSAFRDVKGTSNQIWLFTPGYLLQENGSNLKKRVFMSRIGLLDPKLTPRGNFSNFQAEKNVFIFKRAAAAPWLINSAKILSKRVLTIKTKSHV